MPIPDAAAVSPGVCSAAAAPLPAPEHGDWPPPGDQQLASWLRRLHAHDFVQSTWLFLHNTCSHSLDPSTSLRLPTLFTTVHHFSLWTTAYFYTWQLGERPGGNRLHLQRQLAIQQTAPQPTSWDDSRRLLWCAGGDLRTCSKQISQPR